MDAAKVRALLADAPAGPWRLVAHSRLSATKTIQSGLVPYLAMYVYPDAGELLAATPEIAEWALAEHDRAESLARELESQRVNGSTPDAQQVSDPRDKPTWILRLAADEAAYRRRNA